MEAVLSSFLIHCGTLVCMDAAGTVVRGDLLVRDDRIAALGDAVPAALAALPGGHAIEAFDAGGALVVPGFVHGHLHLCQTLFRGLAEQSDLLRWLRESIWPLEAAHTEASIAASVRLGVLELLAGGVTCVNDMGTARHTDVMGEVLAQTGLRAMFGQALMDEGEGVPEALREDRGVALADALALAQRFHGTADGRLHVSLAPRFILSCSEALWHDVAAASRERGLLVHTHIAEAPERGRRGEGGGRRDAAPYFARHEVLSGALRRRARRVARRRRAGPAGARRRGARALPGLEPQARLGLRRRAPLARAGIRCGLGSDGAACNNRLDTFAEMGLAAGHRARAGAARRHSTRATWWRSRPSTARARWGSASASARSRSASRPTSWWWTSSAPHRAPFERRGPVRHARARGAGRATCASPWSPGRVLYERGDVGHARSRPRAGPRRAPRRARWCAAPRPERAQ